MFKLNKKEAEDYLIKIFDFIENGDSKFNGHPGLYFFHAKTELKEKINELLSENEYDEFDLYYITSLLIKFMLGRYDSHTKVSFKDNVYIPIDFTVEENSLYIANITPIYKKIIGGKLLKINNIDIQRILCELEEIICYSTKEHLLVMIQSFLSDVNVLKSLPSIENNTKEFIYTILNDNNEKENITFNINNLPEFYSVHFPENYSTEVINDCCIIHYNSCRDKDKMEQLISKLKEENNIKNYIIDLRYNGGGSSSVIKPLINFLKDKNIVALVNEYVFSSGRMALVELKKIGAYIIGTDIGTSLNCFGNCPSNLDIDKLNLRVTSSSTYWYYDKELSLTGYEKDEFNTYFNNKKELLEPVLLHPDKYVYLTKEDIINEYDEQKKEAINYFKKIKEVNRIVGKNKR